MMNMGAVEVAVQRLIFVGVEIMFPLLVLVFVAALVIGIFQAMTQVQEQSLSFGPKLLIVALVFIILGPSMFDSLVQNIRETILWIPSLL